MEEQQDISKQLYELQCAWHQWMHEKDRDRVEPGRSLLDLSREVDQAVVEPGNVQRWGDMLGLFLEAVTLSRFSLSEIVSAGWNTLRLHQEHGTHDLAPEESPTYRISTCVEACEGIPTSALRYGVVKDALAACHEALKLVEEAEADARRAYPGYQSSRPWELLKSRLRLVLSKAEYASTPAAPSSETRPIFPPVDWPPVPWPPVFADPNLIDLLSEKELCVQGLGGWACYYQGGEIPDTVLPVMAAIALKLGISCNHESFCQWAREHGLLKSKQAEGDL